MTVIVRVVEVEPDALVAVSVTVYVPSEAKRWVGLRFVETTDPSPKFHDQPVTAGVPEDVSVNATVSGAGPDVTLAANEVDGGPVTVTWRTAVDEPVELVAMSVTVYTPGAANV